MRILTCLVVLAASLAHGQTYTTKILHAFTGPDGADPYSSLIRDAAGNLYGTTLGGGDMSCLNDGCGTVFKLDAAGNETILHKFTGPDGANPEAAVIRDTAGNMYGTTWFGGAFGQGTVFRIDAAGTETVLYSFSGTEGNNSVIPSGLVQDAAGNLYGSTYSGGLTSSNGGPNTCGAYGCGAIFKLDLTGKETVLYSFTGGTDGQGPRGGVNFDAAGNLYGTTYQGGVYGCGIVFKVDLTGKETVLYSFTGGADGGLPTAGVILDTNGNIYGTTSGGGIGSSAPPTTVFQGWGIVFKIDTTGKETVLYSFTGGRTGERLLEE